MNAPTQIPPLTTVRDMARQLGLSDAAVQRLRRLLRGREAGVASRRGRPPLYSVADVERAVKIDRYHRTPLPARDDLVPCACGKRWIDQEAKAAHVARGECTQQTEEGL